jgi:hypothetical protein
MKIVYIEEIVKLSQGHQGQTQKLGHSAKFLDNISSPLNSTGHVISVDQLDSINPAGS